MFFIDELKDARLYRKAFLLPIDEKNKRRGSAAIIFGPTSESYRNVINHPKFYNRYYNSYFLDRAIMYYINGTKSEDSSSDESISEMSCNLIAENLDIFKHGLYTYTGYDCYREKTEIAFKNIKKWLSDLCNKFKINIKTVDIEVSVTEEVKEPTPQTLYILPETSINSDFVNYDYYLKFMVCLFLCKKYNAKINDSLATAIAIKESGLYDYYMDKKGKTPFNYDVEVGVRSVILYENNNGTDTYVRDIVRGAKGECKLTYTIYDLIHMLNKDLQKAFVTEDTDINETGVMVNDNSLLVLNEDTSNTVFKRLLFDSRIKSVKELKDRYAVVTEKAPNIKYAYASLSMYKGLNMFFDLSMYNEAFIRNSNYKANRGFNIYYDLMMRLLNPDKLKESGYNKQCIIIPVNDWYRISETANSIDFLNIMKTINPLSCIYKCMVAFPEKLEALFGDRDVIFLGEKSYMKMNFSRYDKDQKKVFYRNISKIITGDITGVEGDDLTGMNNMAVSSPKAIKVDIIDKVEKSMNVTINNIASTKSAAATSLTATPIIKPSAIAKSATAKSNVDTKKETESNDKNEKIKQELVDTVDRVATSNDNINAAEESLEDDRVKQLLSDLAAEPDNGPKISGARASRMLKLQDDFMDSEFDGKKVRDIINQPPDTNAKVEPIKLNIDSVNKEWENLTFASTLDSYNLNDDIVRIFGAFSQVSNPLAVTKLSAEDTSTSEDLIVTYTCSYESSRGERFTIKVDIPKFIDNKYMKLRGNRKNIPIQLFLMPIIKTGEDTVQVVSSYNKIFIRRFGSNSGKSNVCTDKLIKTLSKNEFKNIKIVGGDNAKICSKYELPIDYIDLAGLYTSIETPSYKIMFNYDEIIEQVKPDESKGLCVGYTKKDKSPLYYDKKYFVFASDYIKALISSDCGEMNEFEKVYDNASKSVRYCFSRASILSSDIPLIVICAYNVGLEEVLRKAKIKYSLSEKRPSIDPTKQDIIRFSDGYLMYDLSYASSLLLNGLKVCDTENYSIVDINKKPMYLNFLDGFGGRIKADGLDNFYDCMIDPITHETLQHYKLPTDYIEVLLHANLLLSDNKYVKHGDIRSSRRMKKAEQVADYLYRVLSSAYGAYSTGIKHGRKVGMSVKQSAVIDAILTNNTTEDQSILNALGEYEAYYTVTPKGASGMNSDRSYSLDKRSYDESMLNVVATSTGFAGNVGIGRQATIDANIEGSRGYINNDNQGTLEEINPTKTISMTEALTPFGSTRNDPIRQAMGFIQTSKHEMRCEHADPPLITNGADEALPYLVSNTFAFKAKENGVVKEIVPDQYMIIEYDKSYIDSAGNETKYEYVKLNDEVQKNSSSGFYIDLKLDTDLKEGSKVKKGSIVAYDKDSFSDEIGADKNIGYKIGTLAKFAILNTDEGFEDSAIISDTLSEALTSEVVLEKDITISKDSQVYNLIKKGDHVEEGDTLCIIQNAYDEEDTNTLLRKLGGSEEEITELGRKTVTSKVTGIIQDIIVYRTVDDNELSPTLKKIVKDYERGIKEKKAALEKYGIADADKSIPDIGKLPATGQLKNASDSVVIKIYMKYRDKFSVGDKLIYGTAVKGVTKDIFPKGQEPYSEYRKNEKLHALLSIGSINARMVTSVLITTAINKGLIELSRKCKDMAGIPYDDDLL